MNLENATMIANAIIGRVAEFCEPGYCRVGGSVRRGKADGIHDIEIVAKPIRRAPVPEFGARIIHKTLLDKALHEIEHEGLLRRVMGGDRLKQYDICLPEFGLPTQAEPFRVEFYLCIPPSQWGVLYTIRTGPSKDGNMFSKWMVTEKSAGGALPDGYICEGNAIGKRIVSNGKWVREGLIEMPTEEEFFSFCGLDWIEPARRQARWGMFGASRKEHTA